MISKYKVIYDIVIPLSLHFRQMVYGLFEVSEIMMPTCCTITDAFVKVLNENLNGMKPTIIRFALGLWFNMVYILKMNNVKSIAPTEI